MKTEFSLHGLHIRIDTDCGHLLPLLDTIAVTAAQENLSSSHLGFQVSREGRGYVIRSGKEKKRATTAEQAVLVLMGAIHSRIFTEMEGRLWVHCGCAQIGNTGFLLVGKDGSGKSTLIGKMLLSGFSVRGDEGVFLEETQVIPFPRKLSIQKTTMDIVPELAILRSMVHRFPDGNEKRYFFEPQDFGCEWTMEKGPVHAVFYLDPNHGAESRLEKIPKTRMIELMMREADNYSSHPGRQIENLCATVNGCACFILHNGRLDTSLELIAASIELSVDKT